MGGQSPFYQKIQPMYLKQDTGEIYETQVTNIARGIAKLSSNGQGTLLTEQIVDGAEKF